MSLSELLKLFRRSGEHLRSNRLSKINIRMKFSPDAVHKETNLHNSMLRPFKGF